MQLVTILLFAVAILTILSGFAVLVGSRKTEKVRSICFFLATVGAGLWAVSIATFLALSPERTELAPVALVGVYTAAVLMDVALLGYISWHNKLGKLITGIFALVGVFLAAALIYDPSVLYSSYAITGDSNEITIVNNWYYWTYLIYFMAITGTFSIFLLYDILHTKNRGIRSGLMVFFVGMSFAGVLALICDILLPFLVRYDLIWVGPLSISAAIIAFYYAILRYRILVLDAGWLKVLSYVIIMASAAMVYMVIFFIIFTALFKVPNPSASIFVLNFIMVAIVLLLIPVINELNSFIRSLIQTNQVDIAYIVKRMNKMAPSNVDLNDLSGFLADHMHFSYIGLLVGDKLYGSSKITLTKEQIRMIEKLPDPERGIWQSFNEPVAELCREQDINAIAELRDAKGKPFGQILVGKPLGKMGFEHKDLIQLEMIVNLVAAMIDTKAK